MMIISTRSRPTWTRLFDLRPDMAGAEQIDAHFRTDSSLTGATAWLLMCAIAIASVGLNVNSTAVIIGAMLVSPLMGPVVGIGYGAGIMDLGLLRHAFVQLLIGTTVSVLTSALYFKLSPLTAVQSELIARTTPTFWDVLIAFFGGLAGIIGSTRKERSNVVPGVAVATALMPPLCTAGFGIAHGQARLAADALYLFGINCVFIAQATYLGTRLMQLPFRRGFAQEYSRPIRITAIALALGTAVPSTYLAAAYAHKIVRQNTNAATSLPRA